MWYKAQITSLTNVKITATYDTIIYIVILKDINIYKLSEKRKETLHTIYKHS